MRRPAIDSRLRNGVLAAAGTGCIATAWLLFGTGRGDTGRAALGTASPPAAAESSPAADPRVTRHTAGESHAVPAAVAADPRHRPAPESARIPGTAAGSSGAPRGSEPASTSLSGSLVWHPSVDQHAFEVWYRQGPEDSGLPLSLAQDGHFRLLRSRPGTVDIVVRMVGEATPLKTIFDVVVPEAGVGRDPRLQAIDVTDVRRVTLTLVDAGGQPIVGWLHALVLESDGEIGRHVREQRVDGLLSLLTRGPDQKAEVWAFGYARRRLALIGDQQVALTGSAVVRVHVQVKGEQSALDMIRLHLEPAAGIADGGERHELLDELSPQSEADRMAVASIPAVSYREHSSDPTRGSAQWTFAVSEPGPYRAFWSV